MENCRFHLCDSMSRRIKPQKRILVRNVERPAPLLGPSQKSYVWPSSNAVPSLYTFKKEGIMCFRASCKGNILVAKYTYQLLSLTKRLLFATRRSLLLESPPRCQVCFTLHSKLALQLFPDATIEHSGNMWSLVLNLRYASGQHVLAVVRVPAGIPAPVLSAY